MRDNLTTLVSGMALGALLMYMLDPDSGRRRRAMVKDRATSMAQDVAEVAQTKAQDLRNRAQGLISDAKGALQSAEDRLAETNA